MGMRSDAWKVMRCAALILVAREIIMVLVCWNWWEVEPEGDVHTLRVLRESVGRMQCMFVGLWSEPDVSRISAGWSLLEQMGGMMSSFHFHLTRYQWIFLKLSLPPVE